jgi:hypothetical protein
MARAKEEREHTQYHQLQTFAAVTRRTCCAGQLQNLLRVLELRHHTQGAQRRACNACGGVSSLHLVHVDVIVSNDVNWEWGVQERRLEHM